jgi:hypothetical protein
MAILTLRTEHRRGLARLFALGQDAADSLVDALEHAQLALRQPALVGQIAPNLEMISANDIAEIVSATAELSAIAQATDVPASIVADDAFDAVSEKGPEFPETSQIEPGDRVLFTSRLDAVMGTRAIAVVAKARRVLTEHEHYLCYARIMTDIRPVFAADVSEKPSAAIVVHSLKIAYHEGSDTKEFFVAINRDGVDNLIELLTRAKEKGETLNKVLVSADIPNLEPE